jgi:hypothetical protein
MWCTCGGDAAQCNQCFQMLKGPTTTRFSRAPHHGHGVLGRAVRGTLDG